MLVVWVVVRMDLVMALPRSVTRTALSALSLDTDLTLTSTCTIPRRLLDSVDTALATTSATATPDTRVAHQSLPT
jgi:hypothetical protein